MYERFTDRARKVIQLAKQEAYRLNHDEVGTEHLLLGLVKEGAGVAAYVLKDLGIDLHALRRDVETIVPCGPEDVVWIGKMPLTPYAKRVLWSAIEEAHDLEHYYVGTEHLLLGLVREVDGVPAQVLIKHGVRPEEVRFQVLDILGVQIEQARGGQRACVRTPSTQGCPGPRPSSLLASLYLFAGGLLSTLAGAFLGAGCCPAGVEAGAWLAGALYVAAVALTHRPSPR